MRQAIRSALAGVALTIVTAMPALAEGNVYTVQQGDSLNDVATRFGVTSAEIVRANGIPDADLLQPGQTLRLPSGITVDRAQVSSRGNRPDEGAARHHEWPLQGPITTYFGERGPWWRLGWHPGLDIGVPIGTPIRSIGAGVVIEADDTGASYGYGHYVKIDHGNGLHSLYAHMSTVNARVGDRVLAGSLLGHVGMTGVTTGPHLHLEVRQDGAVVDPLKYLP